MIEIYPNFLDEVSYKELQENFSKCSFVEHGDKFGYIIDHKSCINPNTGIEECLKQFGELNYKEFLVYDVGAYSKRHVDIGHGKTNTIWSKTAILFCNDEYEGGDFIFNTLQIMMKPKANTLLVFPANDNMFDHEVLKVTAGVRVTAVFRFK